ncbi:hypothetical protein MMC25_006901 [Agyrium rufum]|nr:hypothetical protein [Agyrium rufum]
MLGSPAPIGGLAAAGGGDEPPNNNSGFEGPLGPNSPPDSEEDSEYDEDDDDEENQGEYPGSCSRSVHVLNCNHLYIPSQPQPCNANCRRARVWENTKPAPVLCPECVVAHDEQDFHDRLMQAHTDALVMTERMRRVNPFLQRDFIRWTRSHRADILRRIRGLQRTYPTFWNTFVRCGGPEQYHEHFWMDRAARERTRRNLGERIREGSLRERYQRDSASTVEELRARYLYTVDFLYRRLDNETDVESWRRESPYSPGYLGYVFTSSRLRGMYRYLENFENYSERATCPNFGRSIPLVEALLDLRESGVREAAAAAEARANASPPPPPVSQNQPTVAGPSETQSGAAKAPSSSRTMARKTPQHATASRGRGRGGRASGGSSRR